MANNVYRGDSSNGKDLFMTLGDVGARMTILASIPSGNCFYVVCENLDPYGNVPAHSHLVFDFDGDIGKMSGNYREISGNEANSVLEEYKKRYGGNINTPKPQPEPAPKPKPTPVPAPEPEEEEEEEPEEEEELEEEEEEEEDTTPTTSTRSQHQYEEDDEEPFDEDEDPNYDRFYDFDGLPYQVKTKQGSGRQVAPNEGKEGWAISRNISYIIGMVLGFGAPVIFFLFYMFMMMWFYRRDGMEYDWGTILSLSFTFSVFGLFIILSGIACLNAFRHRDEPFHRTHNATMMLGLINFNIFAILGGWLNYRYRVSRFKMKPAKE